MGKQHSARIGKDFENCAEYKELVEVANSIIMKMERRGKITFINDYGQKFFGYTADEILGKDVRILLPRTESRGRDLEKMADEFFRNPVLTPY